MDDQKKEKISRDERYNRYLGGQNPVLLTTSEGLVEIIYDYLDVGVNHFILRFHYREETEMMRRFMKEVRPKI